MMIRSVKGTWFDFPCSDYARTFRSLFYGGPFLTAKRGIPWEDVQ